MKTVGTSFKKDLMYTLFGGENGVAQNEKVFNSFLLSLFEKYMKQGIKSRNKIKKIFLTTFRHMNEEKKIDVISSLMNKATSGKAQDANELIGVFFESFGLIGIKLAQIISHSDISKGLDEGMKRALENLSSSADPYGKKNIFQLFELIFGDSFDEHFEAILERKGSASIKHVYEVRTEKWRGCSIKDKTPGDRQDYYRRTWGSGEYSF